MMRILHIKNRLSYDGATIMEYRCAKELEGEICLDWFLFDDVVYEFEQAFTDLGSIIYHAGHVKKKYNCKNSTIALFRLLQQGIYDTVYCDTDFSGRSVILLLARWAGVKRRIIHSHSSNTEGNKIPTIAHGVFKFLMRFSATDYIACSKEAALWLFPRSVLDKTIILKNGIPVENFKFVQETRRTIRAKYDFDDSCLVIGHVGRFVKMKNHIKLIGIFREVANLYPNSKLMLIGNGELEELIRKAIKDLRLENLVIFLGEQRNVNEYLQAMDAFVFPSIFEGLGISLVEAECSGLATYSSSMVPDEARITNSSKKISLEQSNSFWAQTIVDDFLGESQEQRTRYRLDAWKEIKAAGYDITDSCNAIRTLFSRQ